MSVNDRASTGLTPTNMFLYRCILQSVRIVALFHDVGHPPMSHIMEEVLEKIYNEALSHNGDENWNQEHVEECISSLEYYIKDTRQNIGEEDRKKPKELKINTIYKERILPDGAAIHEKVGISLLYSALSDVVSDLMEKINKPHMSKEDAEYNAALSIYYLMIAELSMAIITDESANDNVCLSIHKIIDGILDSDRLDYIARDSKNSGIDWGSIPYKRIINHSKFIKPEKNSKTFVIAYPKKVSEDISDVLVTRYKMYTRINFHHRCMKNAASMQKAVLELAMDYLQSSDRSNYDETSLCPEIRILWTSLGFSLGERSKKIIRWNDSWLITSLHNAFVKISDDETLVENHKELYECLEEILLNKKKYYTLIKRGSDSMYLVDNILKKAKINKDMLKMLWLKEYNTYLLAEASTQGRDISDKNLLDEQYLNAKESFLRIDMFEKLFQTKDLNLLERIAPPNQISVEKIINETLEQEKSVSISDYKVMQNQAKYKLGIPDREKNIFDSIYLYSRDGNTDKMDYTLLKEQLVSLSNSTPAYFIYFAPNADDTNVEELSNDLMEKISTAIAEKVQERYDELFPEDK